MGDKKRKTSSKPTANQPKKVWFFRRKGFLWPVGIVFGIVSIAVLAFLLSPWPGALLVRITFDRSDRQILAALQKYTPSTPITVSMDQQYKLGDTHALLDVYRPTAVNRALPVVIWTHGGAWVSGDKTDDAPYFKRIAAEGFTVVSLDYTLAPEKSYPTQIFELNAAYGYIAANAARFHIDSNKIFLAGDSAGAQLSSQMDALITNPTYAKQVGIEPSLRPSQLAGTVLFCGIYKVGGLTDPDPNLPKIISWGDNQVVWAYSGTRNSSSPIIYQMSPYYHVTKGFPTTFISGGNGDPLTDTQSMPLASVLQGLGVSTTTLFYSIGHKPSLPHEYQFNLDNADGQNAFTQMITFLHQRS